MKKLLPNYLLMIVVACFTNLYSCRKEINSVQDVPSASNAYGNLSSYQFLDSFSNKLTAALDSLNTVGHSYAIIQNGEVVETNSKGFERMTAAGGNPFTSSSILTLDSISGIFTHLALLSTLQLNNVALDSFIFRYCPKSWSIPAVNKTITFRHLVEHRAGLDSFGLSITDFKRTMETPSSGVGLHQIKFMDYGIVRILLPAIQKVRTIYTGSTRILDSLIATDFRTIVRQNAFKPGGMRNWDLATFNNWHPNNAGDGLDSLYPYVQYHNGDNPTVPAANGRNFFYSTARTGMYLSAGDAGLMYYNLMYGSNRVTAALDSAATTLLRSMAVGSLGTYPYCSGTYKAGPRGQAGTNIMMDFPEENMVVIITTNTGSNNFVYKLKDVIVTSFEQAKR